MERASVWAGDERGWVIRVTADRRQQGECLRIGGMGDVLFATSGVYDRGGK